jgi:plasmid stabilization system protein ParE
MRVRYTATAAHEFADGIECLTQHAPSVVAEFADAIERAVKDVAQFPFSAQETEKKGVRRKYVRRFHYSIFMRSKTMRSSCFTSGTPLGGCPGRTKDHDFLRLALRW